LQKNLYYAGGGERERVVERELLATDVESVESVCAVGAVFEESFFALGELFA
jgi:hypothetical protein